MTSGELPWRAWSVEQVQAYLAPLRTEHGNPVRWAVAGGWGIDLFLGRTTRAHDDLEIVVLKDDAARVLSAFDEDEWQWLIPHDGTLHPMDPSTLATTFQTWLWSRAAEAFVLDVFRNEHEGGTWIYRRDPAVTMPWTDAVRETPERVPYLVPEIVLLFKSRDPRAKDDADLLAALPALDGRQRTWLAATIERADPDHRWLETIRERPPQGIVGT